MYPQTMINVRIDQQVDLKSPLIQQAVTEVEAGMGNSGRVVLRASGTEPLVRVMVECAEAAQATAYAEHVVHAVRMVAKGLCGEQSLS
jgi:phosphoglucosamine mutase